MHISTQVRNEGGFHNKLVNRNALLPQHHVNIHILLQKDPFIQS